ncbi:hypothetical protein CFIMG_001774RA [Ceratocystis fimbriata CBS 114723]|uniref:BTB domain-containing protein n=1 Tax=Ceratocystis fimbriata CBS 114723 TaxID=1035309 RepID=A0A2C5XKS2_9PEZI|nr:hypothetical protein CFIMG_001774RA [Ceratocystis fimbriata CBS 114723]
MSRDIGRKGSISASPSQTPTTHVYDVFPPKSPSAFRVISNANASNTHRRRSKSLGSKAAPGISHIYTASTSAFVPTSIQRSALPTMTPPQKATTQGHHHKNSPSSAATSSPAPAASAAAVEAAAKRMTENVHVFVGPEKQEFIVSRALLCACSPFFGDHLARGTSRLELPTESSSMFELFAVWLHNPVSFPKHLHRALEHVEPEPGRTIDSAAASTRLHWTLVRLHLFAAVLELLPLQDLALDAIQDLYLCRDWDVTPRFISFLYGQCDPFASLRVRRWAVAMVAFALASGASDAQGTEREGGSLTTDPASHARVKSTSAKDAAEFQKLLARYPEFLGDYEMHMRKMDESGLDLAMKNPQLRIPSNTLRNDQRRFAFRQCAFHTHRATAGQANCPYGGDDDVEGRVGLIRKKSRAIRQQRRQAELQMQLQVQLDRQREHQALAAIHREQQQQQKQQRQQPDRATGHNHHAVDDDQDGDYTVAPPRDNARSRSRSQSRTRPHISQLSLGSIPAPRGSPDTLGPLPPLPPKAFSPLPPTPSQSIPRSRLASRGTHLKSYSTSAAVSTFSSSNSRAAVRAPRRNMTDFDKPVPEVETPSTSPTPYLRPAAPIAESIALNINPGKLTIDTSVAGGALTASPPSVSASLQQQIRDQTAKLARHNASFQASSRLQQAMPESPTYASPTLGYAASAMFAAFPSPDSPAPAMRKMHQKKPSQLHTQSNPQSSPPQMQKQNQHSLSHQKSHPPHNHKHKITQPKRAATTPARIEDYLDRKLPDPPKSPEYQLAMPSVDIDAEIASLSALMPQPGQTPTRAKPYPVTPHNSQRKPAGHTKAPSASSAVSGSAYGMASSHSKSLSHSKSFSHSTAAVTATAFATAAANMHSKGKPNYQGFDASAVDALLDEVAISLHIAQYASTKSTTAGTPPSSSHHGHGHGMRVAAA